MRQPLDQHHQHHDLRPGAHLDPRWAQVRHVLAARLDNVGDVLMCGPALRAIRASLPAARLTLWASPAGRAAASLLPAVDDVLVTRSLWQDLGRLPLDPARELALVDELRRRDCDAAILFTSFAQSPYPPAYACYLAGVPLRAGQSREFGGSLLTDWVRPLPDETHQVDRNLHLVESLGFAVASRELAVALPPGPDGRPPWPPAAASVASAEYVVLHSSASAPARRYPAERFAAVGHELAGRTGLRVLLTGTASERKTVAWLAAEIGAAALPLAGETTLPELAALIGRAALVVSGNTAVMHLADALRVPAVVLFAGTELESQWRPRSAPSHLLRRPTACSPCYRFVCPTQQECLDVPPAEVVEAALALLAAGRSAERVTTAPGG